MAVRKQRDRVTGGRETENAPKGTVDGREDLSFKGCAPPLMPRPYRQTALSVLDPSVDEYIHC